MTAHGGFTSSVRTIGTVLTIGAVLAISTVLAIPDLAMLPAEAQTAQTEPQGSRAASAGQEAIAGAAKDGKYAFVLFYRSDDAATQALRKRVAPQAQSIADRAQLVEVNVKAADEKELVKRFDVSRAPMPLVLAIAPTGAVTKHWFLDLKTIQLSDGFVSPGQARCLKALQDGKIVLVCIQNDQTADNGAAMRGVEDFTQDPRYASSTATVTVDPADEREASLLKQLEVAPDTKRAVTVLMAPPASRLATYEGATTKDTIASAVTKSSSHGCDPDSGCCPPPGKSDKKSTKKKPKPAPNVDAAP